MEEIKEIKIEMSPEELADFREFVLEKGDDELELQEIHKVTPGLQREPIITGLVVALGGPVIVRKFAEVTKEWLKQRAENKREKMRMVAKLVGGGKRKLTIEELEQVDKMTKI